MTLKRKQEIIEKTVALLNVLIVADDEETSVKKPERTRNGNEPVEMLTISECCEAIKGLNEYTVRQLIARNVIPFIRTGQGKRGKILIPKAAIVNYFNGE